MKKKEKEKNLKDNLFTLAVIAAQRELGLRAGEQISVEYQKNCE